MEEGAAEWASSHRACGPAAHSGRPPLPGTDGPAGFVWRRTQPLPSPSSPAHNSARAHLHDVGALLKGLPACEALPQDHTCRRSRGW